MGSDAHPADHIQRSDRYRWLWHGYPDRVEERREILQANGRDLIEFTFTSGCVLSVRIALEVLIELTQEKIPPDDNSDTNLSVGSGQGWAFHLANLKSVLEGGIDLRNKNVRLGGVINT